MPKFAPPAGWFLAVCLFTAIALAGLAADLYTKHWAFQSLGMPGVNAVHWMWQDVFGFQTALNPGALFGILEGQTFILVSVSLIFLVCIIAYVIFWGWRSLFLSAVFGMITAGICGNLYDRLGWHGMLYSDWHSEHPLGEQPIYAVRDWILCMIGTFPWPNFNIADALMVCSVLLLLLHGLLFDGPQENTSQEKEDIPETA